MEEIRDAKPPEIRNPYERERVIAMQNAITRATQNDSIDALAEHLSSQIEQRREQQHAVGYTGPEVPLDWQIFVHLRRGYMLKGYSKRIDATPDEYERLVAEHLRGLTRDAQVKIRTREEIIPDIVKTGRFKNQIQTRRKSPPAHYNPDDRKRLEQEMFGMPEAAKAKDYGIYAYLSSRQEPYYTTVNAYGPVRWVLKPHVRARTSITFGDMLDNYDHEWVIPSAVDAVDWYAYGRGLNSARIDPFTESSVDSNVRNNQARYVDALVHGGVSLDDVEAVEWDDGRAMLDHPAEEVQWAYDFLATNPSEDRADAARNRVALYEAAKALADHGIEVRAVPQAGPIPQPLKPDETVAALRGGQ